MAAQNARKAKAKTKDKPAKKKTSVKKEFVSRYKPITSFDDLLARLPLRFGEP